MKIQHWRRPEDVWWNFEPLKVLGEDDRKRWKLCKIFAEINDWAWSEQIFWIRFAQLYRAFFIPELRVRRISVGIYICIVFFSEPRAENGSLRSSSPSSYKFWVLINIRRRSCRDCMFQEEATSVRECPFPVWGVTWAAWRNVCVALCVLLFTVYQQTNHSFLLHLPSSWGTRTCLACLLLATNRNVQ